MANANSTARNDIKCPLDALDALDHACKMTSFLQAILTLGPNGSIPDNTDMGGLYYIMQDIKDRIDDASIVLQSAIKTKAEA